MKKFLMLAVVAFAAVAAPASAANHIISPCAVTDLSPTAIACTGYFKGNLLSGSPADILAQQAGLAPLGLAWDGDFASVTKINSLAGGGTVDWSTANQNPLTTMIGETWVGIHFGNGSTFGNGTAFYKFDAGAAGLQSFMLTMPQGSSGAVLYLTGLDDGGGTGSLVPEPESWALMIAGFGLVGATMRRRRAVAA